MDEEFNLDYDDELVADATQFGIPPLAQADVDVNAFAKALPPVPQGSYIPKGLDEALRIVREVYGETNCIYSEMFCHFVQDVLEGRANLYEAQELMKLLHIDKDRFSGRWRQAHLIGQERAHALHARWMAVWAAENLVRAVINYLKGKPYSIWVERSLYRVSLTEKDDKNMF